MIQDDDLSVLEAAHLWRARKHEGLTAEENAAFKTWYRSDPANAEAYAEALLVWEGTGLPGFEADLKATIDRLEIEEQERAEDTRYASAPWLPRLAGGIAAAAAVIAAFAYLAPLDMDFGDPPIQYQRFANTDRQTEQISLPDRSRITLGPGSTLEFALTEGGRFGRLLEGDAFFRVTPNDRRPFVIETDHADILVTGTTFDLQLNDDLLFVAVGEGSVRLSGPGKNSTDSSAARALNLVGGQAVTASRAAGFGEIAEVFPAELGAWRRGRLIYRNTPLSEVVADLNRMSAVPITVEPGVADLRINGTFDANNIEFLLEGMRSSFPVSIVKTERQITIKPAS